MEKIKITHINPTDIKGGAALAGYRLHKDLLNYSEVDSVNFVDEKYTVDKEVIKFSNFFLRQLERVLNKLGYFTGLQYWFSINWLPLLLKKRFRETDIFIIRNIHGGLLPFYLPWVLSKFAPVIWRLPDMWPLTGKCVYAYDCDKWRSHCHHCPLLKEYPPLFIDTTSLLFKIKRRIYQKSNLYLVGPSEWMNENIYQSPIFKNIFHTCIHPGVDIDLFKPGAKNEKFTLIFASGSLCDKRKGGEILPSLLKLLNDKLIINDIKIDIYWAGEKDFILPKFSQINNIFLGKVEPAKMAEYYAKAHLHILPTLADNLPNTLLEAMSSGTPAVTFDVGGCAEAVQNGLTGCLVKSGDFEQFTSVIVEILLNDNKLKSMSTASRRLVEKEYTLSQQSEKYLSLIKQILKI